MHLIDNHIYIARLRGGFRGANNDREMLPSVLTVIRTNASLTISFASIWTSTPKLFPSSILGCSSSIHSATLSASSISASRSGSTVSIMCSTWARTGVLRLTARSWRFCPPLLADRFLLVTLLVRVTSSTTCSSTLAPSFPPCCCCCWRSARGAAASASSAARCCHVTISHRFMVGGTL